MHDLRPPAEALADRDATRALAESLGLEFAEASISVADSAQANAESAARELRYDALCSMAKRRGIRWIATGHHADDQAETLLMRLIRGSGPGGLVGVHPSRAIGDQTVIRPMLGITRADSERLCAQAGVSGCRDASNEDQSLLRVAIRARVGPVLEELAPGASTRIAQAAQLQNELLAVLDEATDRLIEQAGAKPSDLDAPRGITLQRGPLADARPVVLGRLLQRLTSDVGRDRSGKRVLDAITDAIGDDNPAPRDFTLGGAQIRVLGHTVEISPTTR
ncbi:MAG: tRNA(Ile)-lysidine synthase [Phycisphaerales bacterium]